MQYTVEKTKPPRRPSSASPVKSTRGHVQDIEVKGGLPSKSVLVALNVDDAATAPLVALHSVPARCRTNAPRPSVNRKTRGHGEDGRCGHAAGGGDGQGLTLVHFSAQPV